MIQRMNRIAGFLALAAAAVCSASEPADRDPLLTGCRDALLAQFAKLESALPEMTRSADAAAERLLGGGRLFAAGQPGFVNEARGRAGGLMMLEGLDDEDRAFGEGRAAGRRADERGRGRGERLPAREGSGRVRGAVLAGVRGAEAADRRSVRRARRQLRARSRP